MLTAEHQDVPLDYEGMTSVKSMLGTKALQCFDETTSVVRTVLRWTEFYKHESCGKCTPCREGTWWLVQILKRMEAGQGQEGDIEKLLDLCENILGRSFCALGDGATSPISSAIAVLPRRVRGGDAHPGLGAVPVRAVHDLRARAGGAVHDCSRSHRFARPRGRRAGRNRRRSARRSLEGGSTMTVTAAKPSDVEKRETWSR